MACLTLRLCGNLGGPAPLPEGEYAGQSALPFRLFLIDAGMPEMDGVELLEKIIDSGEDTGTTVMMLSSSGGQGNTARCREQGVRPQLDKLLQVGATGI